MVAGMRPSFTWVVVEVRQPQSPTLRPWRRTSDNVNVALATATLISAVDTNPTPPPNAVPADSLSQTRGAPKERNNHTLDQGNSWHREFAELGQHVPQLHLEHTAHTTIPPSTSPTPRSARNRLAHTYRVRKVLVTSILGGPLHPSEISPSAEHLACGLDENAAHTCENCCVSTWKQKCTAHAHAATCPVVQPDRPRSP